MFFSLRNELKLQEKSSKSHVGDDNVFFTYLNKSQDFRFTAEKNVIVYTCEPAVYYPPFCFALQTSLTHVRQQIFPLYILSRLMLISEIIKT